MPTIKGAKGDWTVEKDDNHFGTKDRIRITFTPKQDAKGCSDIRLVQSVSIVGYNAAGDVVGRTWADLFKAEQFPHMVDDRVTHDGGDVVIDHVACEGDPYYNGSDSGHDSSSRGDATTTPPTGTSMNDTPGGAFSDYKAGVARVVYTFEVCAVCVATGEVLGCIVWSVEETAADSGAITLPTAEGRPSDGFKKALRKFVSTHTKEKNGKQHWHCPDVGGTVTGPNGGTDPFGGQVPDDFLKAWKSETQENKTVKPDPKQSGSGRSHKNLSAALRAARHNPQRSAVKLTWAGRQIKTVLSAMITGYTEITAEDISPLIPKDSRFANDYEGITVAFASPGWMQELVFELAMRVEQCGTGDSLVGILTDLGTTEAAGYHVAINSHEVTEWMRAIAIHAETGDALLSVVQYAARNLGRPVD